MSTELPVVAVPGIGCDAGLFATIPGCTTMMPDGDSIEATAADLAGRLQAGCVLIGHSMGGYVAMLAAAQVPEKIRSLVLVSTAARADTDEARAARAALIEHAEADYPAAAKRLARHLIAADLPGVVDRAAVETMLLRVGRNHTVQQMKAVLHRPDIESVAATLALPTVVVGGTADAIVAPASTAHLATVVPGARLVQLDGCGHLPTLERPDDMRMLLAQLADSVE